MQNIFTLRLFHTTGTTKKFHTTDTTKNNGTTHNFFVFFAFFVHGV